MKPVFKYLFFANFVWAILFFIFQFYTIFTFQFDGSFNEPMRKAEYIEKGGNAFDYYAGYVWFSSEDSKNYSFGAKFELRLSGRTFARYIYLLGYFALWVAGLVSLSSIATYNYPTNWIAKFFEEEPEKEETKKEIPQKPGYLAYVFGVITSVVSLYSVYYTFIYITKFWHQ